jgi:hypothetical protein
MDQILGEHTKCIAVPTKRLGNQNEPHEIGKLLVSILSSISVPSRMAIMQPCQEH